MKIFDSFKTCLIVWVWKHTPNCAEMSRLASRSLEQPPSLSIRLRMRLHYLICVWCKRYFKQLKFLHAVAPHFHEHAEIPMGRGLSAEAKLRILQRLRGG